VRSEHWLQVVVGGTFPDRATSGRRARTRRVTLRNVESAVRTTDALIDAARDAIAERGWDATTMEEIAAAAGVSRMTLHRRGLTREGLLDALRDALVAEEREALWPALTSAGSGRERLVLALSALCEVSERNLAVLPALTDDVRDEVFHEPGDGALTRGEFTAPFRRLLEDGAADGTLAPPGDLDELATVLYNQVSWTYRHLRTGHRWTPERARSAVVELAVRGVSA
jgi:AcrR family transcriptional regulator